MRFYRDFIGILYDFIVIELDFRGISWDFNGDLMLLGCVSTGSFNKENEVLIQWILGIQYVQTKPSIKIYVRKCRGLLRKNKRK